MKKRIMLIALTILCLLFMSWSICMAKNKKIYKDFKPPTISHDVPSTISLLDLPFEAVFAVEDNREVAYYVVQYDQAPDNNRIVYLPPGIVSQDFSVPLDFRLGNNPATLLVAVADSAGNISRLELEVTLDVNCPGCDLSCKEVDDRGYYDCSDYFNIDFTGANLSGANFRGQHLSEGNFTNADLTGVDFSSDPPELYTNLVRATFIGADLLGANFTNTDPSSAEWAGARCPDGSYANDHGDTCEGHLTP